MIRLPTDLPQSYPQGDERDCPPKFLLQKPSLSTLKGTRVVIHQPISYFTEVLIDLSKVLFLERRLVGGDFKIPLSEKENTTYRVVKLFLASTCVHMDGGELILYHPFEEVSKMFQSYRVFKDEP